MNVEYTIIDETISDMEFRNVRCFGIKITTQDGVTELHCISTDRQAVEQLVHDCNVYGLSPIHIGDVIEDRFY